ncbi:unnamed protein product [Closterium sp. Naga37s-1]|nr:unnamed protein product [Closterium sp. Naga37s-1]
MLGSTVAGGKAGTEEKAAYQWKKYGQKFLVSQNAKRFYYHCAERDTTGCPAKLIIDKVPKKKSKNGRRSGLQDLVAREVPEGSAARRPPINGAVVGADRESGSPRAAVADGGEKEEEEDDSSFGWEENREILDALPVLERRVDRTLTPRRFWCRNRHNHLPPPQQPLHMVVSAAAVAQPRMYVTAASAGAAIATAAATVLPPAPAGIMTFPPAAALTPTVARTASSTSGAASAAETPRRPLTPNLADWPFPPKSRSQPMAGGEERGSPPCAQPSRKRPRSPARAADDHHKISTTDAAAGTGWDHGSAMMTRRHRRSGNDYQVLSVKRGDPALLFVPPPPVAPAPPIVQYLFPHVGAFSATSTLEAPLLSAVLESLCPTAATAATTATTAAAAAAAAAGAPADPRAASQNPHTAAAARGAGATAAGVRRSASGFERGLLRGIAGAQSPVDLTPLVFPRAAHVSPARGDPADATRAPADASAATALAEGFDGGGAACGKADEGFDTLWSYVEANLLQRVASQAAAAAAATAAAPHWVASQSAAATATAAAYKEAAGPHRLAADHDEGNAVQHRLAVSLPRGLPGLGDAQREAVRQQRAEEGAAHAGTSCTALPPLSSSFPAASTSAAAAAASAPAASAPAASAPAVSAPAASAAAAAAAAAVGGGVTTGVASRRFEELQALYLQGLLSGQGLVGSGGEGLVGMERLSTEKKMSALAGKGVGEVEGRTLCVDEGKPGLRDAGGRGGDGGMVVPRVAVEMDLIGQLGDGTAVGRQAAGSGAPQVLSTDLCL